MDKKDIYKIWAPFNMKWTDWVRPVPFIGLDKPKETNTFIDYNIPKINYINELKKDTAIIVDELGVDSIKEGIVLAHLGYRPIPIFNGTNPNINSKSTTNNEIIEELLIWGAYQLKNIHIDSEASPVFLTDKNRLNRYKSDRSVFDNSWDIYHQDLPSYKYFLEQGINNIIIKGPKINQDLAKILYKHQKNGINILYTNGYDEPVKVTLKKVKEEL